MSEESTTPDLAERMRLMFDAAVSGDWDEVMSAFAPDAVWDISPMGGNVLEGRASIRNWPEDWLGTFYDLTYEVEEHIDEARAAAERLAEERG